MDDLSVGISDVRFGQKFPVWLDCVISHDAQNSAVLIMTFDFIMLMKLS